MKLATHAVQQLQKTWYFGSNDRFNYGLEKACQGGNITIIDKMIEIGATDWDVGFHGACLGGHTDIIKLMLDRGVTTGGFERTLETIVKIDASDTFAYLYGQHRAKYGYWAEFFKVACQHNSIQILLCFKNKNISEEALQCVRKIICQYPHIAVFNFLSENYPHIYTTDLFIDMCRHGCLEHISTTLVQHELQPQTIKQGFIMAAKYAHLRIVNLLKDYFEVTDECARDALIEHCKHKSANLELVKILVRGHVTILPRILYYLCYYGHEDILRYLLPRCDKKSMPPPKNKISEDLADWNFGLYGACRGSHVGIINMMFECSASDMSMALKGSISQHNFELTRWLLFHDKSRYDIALGLAIEYDDYTLLKYLMDLDVRCNLIVNKPILIR